MKKIAKINFTKWICLSSLLFILSLLLLIVGPLLWKNLPDVGISFLLDQPVFAGKEGGVGPVLRGTVLLTFIAIFISVILGLPVAIQLSHPFKKNKRIIKTARLSLDLLASTPSIVFGLFGNYFFVITI